MPDILNLRVVTGLRLLSRLGSLSAILLGVLVLLGWAAGSPAMATVLPGLAAMSPLTACAFVLAGSSLAARQRPRLGLADMAATLLLVLSAIVIASYGFARRDVIDPIIATHLSSAPNGPVDSTSPAMACGFLLLGASLLRLGRTGDRPAWIATACSGAGLLLSGLALLGYAYGVEGLYATAFYHTTALHTASGLFVLFLACLFHDPSRGWPAIIAFDPFFTTKPTGLGTGLGLSMIYGFAQQSGGKAFITSAVGYGTTVCLYLPRHHGTSEDAPRSRTLIQTSQARQNETVLVVDDEPTVRLLVTETLAELGYTAIEAADGVAGLKVLQSGIRVDLLITDVGLPGGMNGGRLPMRPGSAVPV